MFGNWYKWTLGGAIRHGGLAAAAALALSVLTACGGSDNASAPPDPGPTVARVEVSPTRLSLAPGQTARLTARALDAAGMPVAATVSWHSSDTTVVVIESDAARAVGTGSATIWAVVGTVTSAALPVRVAAPTSSAGLIDAALRAGAIDAPTALKYKVFAAYDDPRLPFEYLGNQRPRYDNRIGFELALAFDRLSAADQAELFPFMVPPAYTDSWLALREAGAAATGRAAVAAARDRVGPAARPVCRPAIAPGWRYIDSQNFRVWYRHDKFPGDDAVAVQVANFLEESRSKLLALGMREPLADDSLFSVNKCVGGSASIDAYLVESGLFGTSNAVLGVTEPLSGTSAKSSAFIILNRNIQSMPEFFAAVAHEYMHVVQAAYENHLNMPDEALAFISDAIADWAPDYVRPNDNGEHGSAKYLMDAPTTPLWASSSALKRYGGYLFFQFVARLRDSAGNGYGGPAVVKDLWQRIAAQPTDRPVDVLALLDAVLPRGLTETWNGFAVALYNRHPVTSTFQAEDGLSDRPLIATRRVAAAAPASLDLKSPVDNDGNALPLPELSLRIERFEFADDDVSTVTYFNGFTYGLKPEALPLRSEAYDPPLDMFAGETLGAYVPTSQERGPGRRLTALIRVGTMWTVEDWTNVPIRFFCRERLAERIDELVLIYSNGAFSSIRPPAQESDNAIGPVFGPPNVPEGQPSRLLSTRMPCHQIEGSSSSTITVAGGGNNFTATNVLSATFRGQPARLTITVQGARVVHFLPAVMFETISGTKRSTLQGLIPSCNAAPISQETSYAATSGRVPSFSLLTNYLPGTAAQGGYAGWGGGHYFVLTTPTPCTTGATIETPPPEYFNFDFLWQQPVSENFFKVDLDRRTLNATVIAAPPPRFTGSFPASWLSTRRTWCFVATREGQTAPGQGCL
jgi:hypothetical protein